MHLITNLMHLIKHLGHPGKYITKHQSWDKPAKTAKLLEQNHTKTMHLIFYITYQEISTVHIFW